MVILMVRRLLTLAGPQAYMHAGRHYTGFYTQDRVRCDSLWYYASTTCKRDSHTDTGKNSYRKHPSLPHREDTSTRRHYHCPSLAIEPQSRSCSSPSCIYEIWSRYQLLIATETIEKNCRTTHDRANIRNRNRAINALYDRAISLLTLYCRHCRRIDSSLINWSGIWT